jgi:hypothetical protein
MVQTSRSWQVLRIFSSQPSNNSWGVWRPRVRGAPVPVKGGSSQRPRGKVHDNPASNAPAALGKQKGCRWGRAVALTRASGVLQPKSPRRRSDREPFALRLLVHKTDGSGEFARLSSIESCAAVQNAARRAKGRVRSKVSGPRPGW